MIIDFIYPYITNEFLDEKSSYKKKIKFFCVTSIITNMK